MCELTSEQMIQIDTDAALGRPVKYKTAAEREHRKSADALCAATAKIPGAHVGIVTEHPDLTDFDEPGDIPTGV